MSDLPAPLVPPDCDCTNLDGFSLNVERLMASELVALSSHEVIAAALFLWCRAWKQIPAASLPDDDRVNASFARLSLARFKKFKKEIMRGFVKCSDGRLYHHYLSLVAIEAFERKKAFLAKRGKDAERLRNWRNETRSETHDETHDETHNETRFVAEGVEGKGVEGSSNNNNKPEAGATPPFSEKKRGESSTGGTPIPDGWIPTPEGRAFAEGCGFKKGWPYNRALSDFRAYHVLHATVSPDWNAQWQSWVLKRMRMAEENHGHDEHLVEH